MICRSTAEPSSRGIVGADSRQTRSIRQGPRAPLRLRLERPGPRGSAGVEADAQHIRPGTFEMPERLPQQGARSSGNASGRSIASKDRASFEARTRAARGSGGAAPVASVRSRRGPSPRRSRPSRRDFSCEDRVFERAHARGRAAEVGIAPGRVGRAAGLVDPEQDLLDHPEERLVGERGIGDDLQDHPGKGRQEFGRSAVAKGGPILLIMGVGEPWVQDGCEPGDGILARKAQSSTTTTTSSGASSMARASILAAGSMHRGSPRNSGASTIKRQRSSRRDRRGLEARRIRGPRSSRATRAVERLASLREAAGARNPARKKPESSPGARRPHLPAARQARLPGISAALSWRNLATRPPGPRGTPPRADARTTRRSRRPTLPVGTRPTPSADGVWHKVPSSPRSTGNVGVITPPSRIELAPDSAPRHAPPPRVRVREEQPAFGRHGRAVEFAENRFQGDQGIEPVVGPRGFAFHRRHACGSLAAGIPGILRRAVGGREPFRQRLGPPGGFLPGLDRSTCKVGGDARTSEAGAGWGRPAAGGPGFGSRKARPRGRCRWRTSAPGATDRGRRT